MALLTSKAHDNRILDGTTLYLVYGHNVGRRWADRDPGSDSDTFVIIPTQGEFSLLHVIATVGNITTLP